VRAWRDEDELCLGAPRQKVVLAVLAMRAGLGVSRDELVDAVWDDPPGNAVNSVHIYVAGLREVLEPGRARRAPGTVLVTGGPGYLLPLEPGQVDAAVFRGHLAAARRSRTDGDLAAAAESLDAALGLWQGNPLAGIGGPWAQIERVRLSEARLAAVEDRAEVRLGLGWHHELVSELSALAGEYPLRERLRCLLMLALYRCGQQADALAVFRDTRRVLDAELGIEPGPALQDLHQQILAGDAALGGPWPGVLAGAGWAGNPVPQELPADVAVFTGRADELAELDRLLPAAVDRADASGGPGVVISAVAGTAGVGKTALAVRWAHRVRPAFPDGQLYVNMRGYDPGQLVTAGDALAGFLRALGVPGQDIPAETDERAAKYRSMLAGKRMLVVLDNAHEAEQVRPLLPGTSGCAVVITSRDSLAALVAREGAVRMDLDLLPMSDAVALLRDLIGGRAGADPVATTDLAAKCARLPLALRVAAELAAARPDVPLADLARELADQQQRLDLLEAGGDPRTAIRAVFSWSYQHLDPDAARAFRLLGLHPGPHLDRYAAAALTGTAEGTAGQLLDRLARAHLIHPAKPSRYGMHDLLRGYAAEQASRQGTEPELRAALTRLFDYYLATAAAAIDTLHPAERHRRPRVSPPSTPIPPVTSPIGARAWLDAQLATLIAVAEHTAAHGWPAHTTRLAATLYRYLDVGSHYPEALIIHSLARRAARQACDRAAEATALANLGAVDWRLSRYRQAADRQQQALALFRQTGDKYGEARALGNLGMIDWRLGRYPQAAVRQQQALALFRQTGDRYGEARALGELGDIDSQLGRYPQAAAHQQQALALYREIGDRTGEAQALTNLGSIDQRLGRYPQAASHLRKALALFRETGNRLGEAHALTELGGTDQRLGRYQQAADHLKQALALLRETGDRAGEGEAEALNGLGEIQLAVGQPGKARAQHAAALELAGQVGDPYQQARAHAGLASACHANGDLDQARRHWEQAHTRYAELGVPEADKIFTHLAALDDAPPKPVQPAMAPDPRRALA